MLPSKYVLLINSKSSATSIKQIHWDSIYINAAKAKYTFLKEYLLIKVEAIYTFSNICLEIKYV